MVTIPSNVGYGTVTWNVFMGLADGPDADALPDAEVPTGTITFVPGVEVLRNPSSTPKPTTLLPRPVVARLNDDGDLATLRTNGSAGQPYVQLFASDDPDLNPNPWPWSVVYDLRDAAGNRLTIPTHKITVLEGQTIDLTTVGPVSDAAPVGKEAAEALAAVAVAQVQLVQQSAAAMQALYDAATTEPTGDTIAKRNGSGQMRTADATALSHAMPKGQADSTYLGLGEVSLAANGGSVGRRKSDGRMEVADGIQPADAASKRQLDTLDVAKAPVYAAPRSVKTDGSYTLQQAIDGARAAKDCMVRIPASTNVMTSGVGDSTSGYLPGLHIIADPGAILMADFNNGAIIDLNGTGTLGQSQGRGRLENLVLRQKSGRLGVHGIQSAGVWQMDVKNVDAQYLSGNVINIPDRSDISSNPDYWASVMWSFKLCNFKFNKGYAIYSKAGVGFSFDSQDCYYSGNEAGGILWGGHSTSIQGGAIAYNGIASIAEASRYTGTFGGYGGGGGLTHERQLSVTPHGLRVHNVEFDGNYGYAIFLEGGYTFTIANNRFVGQLNAAGDAYRSRDMIVLGDAGQQIAAYGYIGHNAVRPVAGSQVLTFINYYSVNAQHNTEAENPLAISGALGYGVRRGAGIAMARTNIMAAGIVQQEWTGGGTLPTPSADYRGQVRVVRGAAGVADRFVMCMKLANDTYAWVDLQNPTV